MSLTIRTDRNKDMMRLGIVIPFKSKKVSRDWEASCTYLQRTLASIHGQTADNYSLVVVVHEKPEFLTSNYGKVNFHSLEIPPPYLGKATHMEYVLDKNLKSFFLSLIMIN